MMDYVIAPWIVVLGLEMGVLLGLIGGSLLYNLLHQKGRNRPLF